MRIDAYAQDIWRIAYIDIRRISSNHHLLSIDAKKTQLSAFVLPKLDYCNSLFNSSPMYMLEWLQKVQSNAARLMLQYHKQNHISPLLVSHNRLHINARIEYGLSVISACLLFTRLINSQSTHPKEIYSLLLAIEFYVSLSCEQRNLGIVIFYLQPPQYGIHCLQNSDILILSRNLSQH